MAEQTLQDRVDEQNRIIDALNEHIAAKDETIKRLSAQVRSLQTGITTVEDLPEEVKADIRSRIEAGLPKDIAIERALVQHEHNQRLQEAAEEAEQPGEQVQAQQEAALKASRSSAKATCNGASTAKKLAAKK
jgi:uncharacterized coiled-coil protein SlyX